MNSVFPLFSYPIMVCSDHYHFTAAEEEFISKLAMADNAGNLMSQNDRILDSIEMSKLRIFIDSQIGVYRKKILRVKKENEIYITQAWANKAKTNEFHPMHKHPNSILSGVLFVTGEEGDGLPPIRFHRSNDLLPLELEFEELNDFNSSCKWFSAIKGRLIIFPSVLDHDVEKNNSDLERITLSFNTFVRGTIGSQTRLSQVEIPKQ